MGKYQAYPEYKDSGIDWIGDIPEHWIVAELKRYAWVQGGYAFSSDSFVDSGIPVIRIGDIKQDGTISLESCKYIQDEVSTQYKDFEVRSGDLLMAMTGATIGKAGWFKGSQRALLNQRVGSFKCNKSFLNYKFFWYVLNSLGYQEYIRITAFGGAQPNISDTGMVSYQSAIPDLIEQEKIASFLDHETAKIDTLIDKQQQLIQLLKEKRQAVISHAVTKGLNPNAPMRDSGVEWLGEVPEHWKVAKVKNTATIISKGTTPTTMGADFANKGVRFLKAENIGKSMFVQEKPSFYISESVDEQISRSQLQDQDVLVIIAGATTGLVSVLQKDLLPANTNQAVSFIRLKDKRRSKFSAWWLSTEFAQRVIWMDAVQAAQPNLSMEDLGNIPIVVPPIDEVTDLVAYLAKQLAKIDELHYKAETAIELMQERRTALISAAVTGKIDVRHHASHPTGNDTSEVSA